MRAVGSELGVREDEVDTTCLGDSDARVSRVILGAWAIGGTMWGGQDEELAVRTIRASLDAGITTIDTAPAYGLGRSEELVGQAIAGRRDDVFLATKCGLRWDRDDGELKMQYAIPGGETARIHFNLKPESIREECENSLRRLGVEHIDLYQVHWPDPRHSLDDAFAELVKLRDQGKVRYLGVSNFDVAQLGQAHASAGIVSDQPQYNLLDRAIEADVLPWCRDRGVGVVCYSPMARGLLTGKVSADREFPETDHRHQLPWFEASSRRRVAAALETLLPLAADHEISLANLAVAWVLAQNGVSAALVGARNTEQAAENARAADVRFSPGELRMIEAAFAEAGC